MKNFVYNISLFGFILLFLLLLSPQTILAQESIKSFDVVIEAQKDGSMNIEENILYDFGKSERHGIFRTIPLVSSVGELYRVISINVNQVTRDGQEEKYSVSQGAKEVEIKIGDADKTINGPHKYLIKYKVINGIGSNFDDHDEIYWNVTGNEWQIPISSASAVVTTNFGVEPNRVACFTRDGSLNGQFCTFPGNGVFNPITTTATLEPGDGLTIVAGFQVNTFPKSTLQKNEPVVGQDFRQFLKIVAAVYGILNLILAPLLIFWYTVKKNKTRFGSVSVNFDMPEDPKGVRITPAEAGTIDNSKLDLDDLVATIYDLAIRKYLKIEEIKEKGGILGIVGKSDYKLVKLKNDEPLNEFEKELMDSIFKSSDTVELSEVKLSYTDFTTLESKNFNSLVSKNLFTKNPKTQMGGLLTLGILSLLSLNLILGIVLIWLSRKLNGRTALGDEMDFKTDGLKLFLKNMSRNYKWQAQNFYFVEKMIPYAFALGFINEYMEQLKILKPDYNPTWYSGTSGNFYNFYPSFSSSFMSNISTSAPSSSSGFSGGSSGGGGGGGGGGSW